MNLVGKEGWMSDGNRAMLDNRIKEYLTNYVRDALKDDFDLVQDIVPEYVARYSLKELIIILRLEVERRKRPDQPAWSK